MRKQCAINLPLGGSAQRGVCLTVVACCGALATGCKATVADLPTAGLAVTRADHSTGAGVQYLSHDFGLVLPGQPLRHEFAVSNRGHVAWTLRETTRTCACAVLEATSPTVAAGNRQLRSPAIFRLFDSLCRTTAFEIDVQRGD